jgi:LCP family protein required for cell wall assembly
MNVRMFFKVLITVFLLIIIVAVGIIGGAAMAYKFFDKDAGDDMIADSGLINDEDTENPGSSNKSKVQNALLLAVDAEGYRTDVIILAQYNFSTKAVNMLQIPRDTKIDTNRSDKKINASYAYGQEKELFQAINNLLGVKVDNYILVNIDGFRDIIDEIGGVEINVPINMYYDDPYQNLHISLNKGYQLLKGREAEMFVRFRKNNDGTGYDDGDLGRIKAQQEFISATIDKIISAKNVFKIPKLAAILIRNVKTNFGIEDISNYIEIFLSVNKENINIMRLPGDSDYINGISYFINDKDETEKILDEYFIYEPNK